MKPRGFVALISAILISSVLFVVVASSSLLGFYTRRTIADGELKARSSSAADACADIALVSLAFNSQYLGSETRTLNILDSCSIGFLTPLGALIRIPIQATSGQKIITNLEVLYEPSSRKIVSWSEVL